MTNYLNAKNGLEILHDDGLTQILSGDEDPSVDGREADLGSIFLRHSDPINIYQKKGPIDTDWQIATSYGISPTTS